MLFTNIVFNPLTLFASLTLSYVSGSEVDCNASTSNVRRRSIKLFRTIYLFPIGSLPITNNEKTQPNILFIWPLTPIVNSISLVTPDVGNVTPRTVNEGKFTDLYFALLFTIVHCPGAEYIIKTSVPIGFRPSSAASPAVATGAPIDRTSVNKYNNI